VEALVSEAGELRIRPLGSTEPGRWLDAAVDPRLAFSPDGELIVYAREDTLRETDLWVVPVAGGAPERLTHWRGTEDRPVVSPDGRSVAFVAGYTGIASWWVVDLAGPRPVPVEAGRQLTNLGLERVAHLPGQAPAGWRPVPDGTEYGWGDAGIEWVSGGARHALQVGSR
jgi:dipeptidyl aminopeptidase/acylaminoacyl peptidase